MRTLLSRPPQRRTSVASRGTMLFATSLVVASPLFLQSCVTDSKDESGEESRESAPAVARGPMSDEAFAEQAQLPTDDALTTIRTRFADVIPSASPVAFAEAGSGATELTVRSAGLEARVSAATGKARVRHEATGVTATFALADAASEPSRGRVEDGLVIFDRLTHSGSHVVIRANEKGIEDYVLLHAPPARGEVTYELEIEQGRALRSINGTLEILDEMGVPRIRVPRPYVVDADGARHAATLRVEGCKVDTDARVPWGRDLVELADQRTCALIVDYDETLAHPVLVDPEWVTTASMNYARTHHTATLLSSGDVLVAGGFDVNGDPLAALEVLCPEATCPAGPAFTELGSTLSTARGAHSATLVSNGTAVLFVGGRTTRVSGSPLASAEIYDVVNETMGAVPSMSVGRWGHTATLLPSGGVLVAGGEDNTSASNAEIYTPGGGWGAPLAMTGHRRGHVAETVTIDSAPQVLLAGGIGSVNGNAVATAELFDPVAQTFTYVDDMSSPRAWATAALTEDTNPSVLIAGGTNNKGFYYSTADVFVPNATGGTFQQQTLTMQLARAHHTATKLVGEKKILITGGTNGTTIRDATEVFEVNKLTTELRPTLKQPRDFHTATLLPSGKVAVIGGGVSGTTLVPDGGTVSIGTAISAEVLYRSNGDPCEEAGECASNVCFKKTGNQGEGVCCNDTCQDICSSCFASAQAEPAPGDGTCAVVADNTPVLSQCLNAVRLNLQCVGGALTATAADSCGAYQCLDQNSCRTSCSNSNDAQCNTGHYCKSTVCIEKLKDGFDCTRDGECDSGHCVDGFCCETKCDGQCQACDLEGLEGRCNQVKGEQPHGNRMACDGADPECRGVCNTNPAKCDYDDTIECGDSTCADGARSFGLCNIDAPGTCTATTGDCGAFRCDDAGERCTETCETAADCDENAVCRDERCVLVETPQCDGDHTVIRPDASTQDCSPLKCAETSCLSQCKSVDDCIEGKVCDSTGDCVDPPPDPAPPDEGCSAAASDTSTAGTALTALAGMMALGSVRRRRKAARGVKAEAGK